MRMAASTVIPKTRFPLSAKHEVIDASTVKFEDWHDEEK
jgi:hypothetical protein